VCDTVKHLCNSMALFSATKSI